MQLGVESTESDDNSSESGFSEQDNNNRDSNSPGSAQKTCHNSPGSAQKTCHPSPISKPVRTLSEISSDDLPAERNHEDIDSTKSNNSADSSNATLEQSSSTKSIVLSEDSSATSVNSHAAHGSHPAAATGDVMVQKLVGASACNGFLTSNHSSVSCLDSERNDVISGVDISTCRDDVRSLIDDVTKM